MRKIISKDEISIENESIVGNGLRVVYKGMRKKEATLMFDVFDEVSDSSSPEQFEFSMKYWESYTDTGDLS